jgi:hypothetical protein
MADKFYFSRDTEVYLMMGVNDAGSTAATSWKIPVLDGFSFSQGTNTSEITLAEMSDSAGKTRRSRQMFTDSYAPAEWSFQTYVRPFRAVADAAGGWEKHTSLIHHAVEEALWANFASAPTFTASANDTSVAVWNKGVDNSTTSMIVDFVDSEVAALGTFDLFFEMGGAAGGSGVTGPTYYRLKNAVVNSASIDFDIDGIATITWSGFASIIQDLASLPSTITTEITEATTGTSNFIRNRLTQLSVTNTSDTSTFPGASGGAYNVVLTGGNVTMENNITYLTPETLGIVNQPLGHVTGTRNVSGNFTCYLNREAGGSADLFEDLIEATDKINNGFNTVFKIGGTSAPKLQIDLPNCHFEVPSHSIDDIISLETSFHALPASVDPTTANNFEAKVTYTGS